MQHKLGNKTSFINFVGRLKGKDKVRHLRAYERMMLKQVF
jgi:hypothetical protein